MNNVNDAIKIICELGLPEEQQNERSGLTLLALLELKKGQGWDKIGNPLLGVTPMMDWMDKFYGKKYAPNSRETIRRQTLHQFRDSGLCTYNPDEPDRAVNSPKACYQIAPEAFDLLKTFGTEIWKTKLSEWLSNRDTLIEKYSMKRNKEMIPLKISEKLEILLSPGKHSKLIRDIVEDFAPRFVGGSEVVYLGDTGAKQEFLNADCLEALGICVDRKGKLPDVILYLKDKNWLILIESATSHGPVDGKRYRELTNLFESCSADLVFVTAFPDRKTMTKFLANISWETEVWVADAPSHMIHFNGDKFLGPYN